jgi:hypothetical protein
MTLLKYVSVDFDSQRQHAVDCSRLQEFAAKGLTVWVSEDFIPHDSPELVLTLVNCCDTYDILMVRD